MLKYDNQSGYGSQQIARGGGGPIWPINERETTHLNSEKTIYTSSIFFEESGYNLDLSLLIILY